MKPALIALLLASSSPVWAADYDIDAFHTNARFAIDHFNTSTNIGGIYSLTGAMKFDLAKKTGSIDIKLPIANLQSSSDEFTKHLKSADLFNEAKYPNMRFVSTRFHFADNKVKAVDGKLTLLGKTHPVTLRADKFNCYDNPRLKTQVCGGDFSATIDRTLWGMNYLVNMGMSKEVRLDIQVEAAKK